MEPLNCDDLIDRGLAGEAHCCALCHDLRVIDAGLGKMQAVIVPTPDGEVEAEICCSQALILNAHEYVKDWSQERREAAAS